MASSLAFTTLHPLLWLLWLLSAPHCAEAARPANVEEAAVQPHGILVRQKPKQHTRGKRASFSDIMRHRRSQHAQAGAASLSDNVRQHPSRHLEPDTNGRADIERRIDAENNEQTDTESTERMESREYREGQVNVEPPDDDNDQDEDAGRHPARMESREHRADTEGEAHVGAQGSGVDVEADDFNQMGQQVVPAPPPQPVDDEDGFTERADATDVDEAAPSPPGPLEQGDLTDSVRDGTTETETSDGQVLTTVGSQDASSEPSTAGLADFSFPREPEVKTIDLFKATAEQGQSLNGAAESIDKKIQGVDSAITNIDGSMDKYHESITGLTKNFGDLRTLAGSMKVGLNGEFEDRERQRLCSFENLDKMLKGEEYVDCNKKNTVSLATSDGELPPAADGEHANMQMFTAGDHSMDQWTSPVETVTTTEAFTMDANQEAQELHEEATPTTTEIPETPDGFVEELTTDGSTDMTNDGSTAPDDEVEDAADPDLNKAPGSFAPEEPVLPIDPEAEKQDELTLNAELRDPELDGEPTVVVVDPELDTVSEDAATTEHFQTGDALNDVDEARERPEELQMDNVETTGGQIARAPGVEALENAGNNVEVEDDNEGAEAEVEDDNEGAEAEVEDDNDGAEAVETANEDSANQDKVETTEESLHRLEAENQGEHENQGEQVEVEPEDDGAGNEDTSGQFEPEDDDGDD